MRKVGLVLILSIFTISTLILFYSITYPTNDANSDEDRNASDISYIQKDQPKISDSYDPNDDFSNAAEINKGWYSSLDCFDDDWFKFLINKDEEFTVDIYFSHSSGNLDMELYNDTYGFCKGSYSADDNETITWTAGYNGYYYIRIYNLTVSGNYYALDIYANWMGDDGFEPNNDFWSAFEIGKGWHPSLKCKDDDWFKFWINKDEEFTVDLYFSHSSGDLDMELYNETYGFCVGSYSADDDEWISWTAEYFGYYYIRIYNFTVDDNYYDLNINIWWGDDKYEYNNDFWSAHEVFKGLNRHLNCRNDDWYKIHLNAGEDITVDIFFHNSSGNLDMALYNETYGYLMGSYSWDDDETLSFTAGYTGYYYIFVYKNIFDDDNEYDMKISGETKTIFYDDFEDILFTTNNWDGIAPENYMHVTSRDSSPESPIKSLWCGNESTGFYNKKVDGNDISYRESAIIQDLDLRDFAYVELTFDARLFTGGSKNDRIYISVKLLGDEYYLSPKYTNYEFDIGGSTENTDWENVSIDLSFFSGYEHVDILFNFEADEFNNYYEGVMIDDVRITGLIDDDPIGYDLGIHKGDEFYYHFSYVDNNGWSEIFGMGIPSSFNDELIKIRIMSIINQGPYWEVTALFWDPWDDFDEFVGTDEFKYEIYKNPINMKGGVDFFIPSGEIWRYLDKADNFDQEWWPGYDIHNEDEWFGYSIEYITNNFVVRLTYGYNGILKGMEIFKSFATGGTIFQMWLTNPPEEEDDEEEDDEEGNSIPGYDIFIIVPLISVVSIVIAIKIKKLKKTKE